MALALNACLYFGNMNLLNLSEHKALDGAEQCFCTLSIRIVFLEG